jgi:hypothetical protein
MARLARTTNPEPSYRIRVPNLAGKFPDLSSAF